MGAQGVGEKNLGLASGFGSVTPLLFSHPALRPIAPGTLYPTAQHPSDTLMKRTREESDAAPPSSPPSRLPFILNPVSGATSESVRRQVLALVYGNKRACLPCTQLCVLYDWTLCFGAPSYLSVKPPLL